VFEDAGALGAVAISILLNVLIFVVILGVGMTNHGIRHQVDEAAALPPLEVAALDPSCDGDALLRAAAQAAMCLTPLADDVDACLDQTQARLDSEISLCHIDRIEALPEIALVDARHLEAQAAIDAEPLLEPLTPEEVEQFQQKLQEQPPPSAPPPPPPPQSQQVIEAPKPANEQVAEDARFLSDYDSKVEKQSAKHENKYEEMVARPQPEELAAKDKPKQATAPAPDEVLDPGKQDAPKVSGALSMRSAGTPEPATVEQDKKIAGARDGAKGPDGTGGPKRGDGAVSQDERHPTEIAQGNGGAGGGSPRAPNLRPDDATLERLVGGGSVDDVKDIDEGDENAFNTKRWVYASFFNRMKRVVAQNWDPVSVWRAEDPDGSHYGFKNRNTVVRVSIDAKGAIEKVSIIGPCGIDSLDEEALRAFKASGPFPNPPQALLDNGLITFEFGFSFTINEKSTSWKVYRSI
jgi:TonB family protein